MQEAYKFFEKSKKGFQCSLCNRDYHQFFNLQNKTIDLDNSFCYEMVSKTFSYFNFEFSHFMKVARLYSIFALRCNYKGEYKNKEIPDYV